ncbi:MAG: polysaccharide deacetylase family protein [Acidobacteria bacterium]|nr:polysaccharide deacetylase family protein [Acidobacteriota bacterium]
MKTKPFASLSLDLDNKWSYMKTHGDAGWESFPSYLDVVVPRVLKFLAERELKITFFIVGQDAALEKNRESLAQLSAAGHEIGNHSFHHEPWMHLNSETEIEAELAQAEEAIERVTGRRPVGFRGPGFIFSQEILRVLLKRGYEYDASTFPTYLGPLARAYYFMTTKLEEEEKRKRKALFGKLRDGLQPLKPYRWQVESGTLVEIPVTTMPVFKVPVHVSYVLYLSRYSRSLARSYFKTALRLCRMTGTELSLLLHPLDFLGGDDVEDLAFFPGMNISGQEKLALVGELLDEMKKHFNVLTMREHAQRASSAPDLPLVAPSFNAREQQI